jgi:prefoldin subunit 5
MQDSVTFELTNRLEAQRNDVVNVLNDKIVSLQRANTTFENEIAKLRSAAVNQNAVYSQQTIEQQQLVRRLQDEIVDAARRRDADTQQQQCELRRLRHVLDSKCRTIDELTKDVDALSNQNARLRGLLADVRFVSTQEIQSLQSQIGALTSLQE